MLVGNMHAALGSTEGSEMLLHQLTQCGKNQECVHTSALPEKVWPSDLLSFLFAAFWF